MGTKVLNTPQEFTEMMHKVIHQHAVEIALSTVDGIYKYAPEGEKDFWMAGTGIETIHTTVNPLPPQSFDSNTASMNRDRLRAGIYSYEGSGDDYIQIGTRNPEKGDINYSDGNGSYEDDTASTWDYPYIMKEAPQFVYISAIDSALRKIPSDTVKVKTKLGI